ncbi:50S ribosomal protein L33 [PVC group bacterium (ex Bugula neritina AB1)]|nr:50S ribosomal protein L33 [PVC group bacterium (ex Bugula neritina AB1)]
MRDIILLFCSGCKRRNYSTTKNKKTIVGKFSIRKYCSFCNKHIEHKETSP